MKRGINIYYGSLDVPTQGEAHRISYDPSYQLIPCVARRNARADRIRLTQIGFVIRKKLKVPEAKRGIIYYESLAYPTRSKGDHKAMTQIRY